MFNTKTKSDHNSPSSSGYYNTKTNGKSFESINHTNNNNNNWQYQNYVNNNINNINTEKLKSNGKSSSSSGAGFGGTGGTILIIIVIIIIAFKLAFLLVDRQRTAENLKEPLMAHEYTKYSIEFLTNIKTKTISISNDYGYILWPTFLSIGIALFTWLMMYLDSDIPGIIPQTPFSPRQYGYRYINERTCHLNYMMSIACGILVFILLYFSNLEK